MRLPLGWLAEWIPLPEATQLAEQLTMAGLEVDSVERTGPDLSAFRVGLVRERAPHPHADRLSVCRVDLGQGDPLEIVCGAPNVAAGQKVAVALPGMQLADGRKLKRSRIRGVESQGMICAPDELGIGDDHSGIVVLDPEAPLGAPLHQVLDAGETVLEVSVLPNRGDCLSLLGMAREVRALFGGDISVPECQPPEGRESARDAVRVEIEDPDGCHAYVAHVVRGVRVGASPEWVQRRLGVAGLRPINVVVDVTNLVLLEFGQPLHAFDLARLRGGVVRVRRAGEGEGIVTLDGEARSLSARDLVIADAERAIAIAGVMGGANTEVGPETRDVLIESAHFNPAYIRHTGRRLNLFTDASYRFERGVDGVGVRRAADRAARLMAELAGGSVCTDAIEVHGHAPDHRDEIRLQAGRVNRLLGTALSEAEIRDCLGRVGIETRAQAGELHCRIPSYRNDLVLPEDLIEEVARIHGYQRIPTTVARAALEPGHKPAAWLLSDRVRDGLEAEGLVELLTLPFLDPRDLDRLGLAGDDPRCELVRVVNPIVESESHLRSTLVPSLLRVARENLNRQVDRLGLFEVSRVFRRAKTDELPDEALRLAALVTRGEPRGPWEADQSAPLFFEVKGMAERLLDRLDREAGFRPGSRQPYLHPGAAAEITVGDRIVGWMGGLHPDMATRFAIPVPCVLLELDLDGIESVPARQARYREVSPYPSVRRDLAVVLDRERPAGEVLEAIRRQGGPELGSVEIFDRYEGAGVPEGKVSLAFRLTFQRADRTLTDAEVGRKVERVVRMLSQRFGGTLR